MAEVSDWNRTRAKGEEEWTSTHPAKDFKLTLHEAQMLADMISTTFNVPRTIVYFTNRQAKTNRAIIWTKGTYDHPTPYMKCRERGRTALTIIHEMSHHGAHGHGAPFHANMRLFVTIWDTFYPLLNVKHPTTTEEPMKIAESFNTWDIVEALVEIADDRTQRAVTMKEIGQELKDAGANNPQNIVAIKQALTDLGYQVRVAL